MLLLVSLLFSWTVPTALPCFLSKLGKTGISSSGSPQQARTLQIRSALPPLVQRVTGNWKFGCSIVYLDPQFFASGICWSYHSCVHCFSTPEIQTALLPPLNKIWVRWNRYQPFRQPPDRFECYKQVPLWSSSLREIIWNWLPSPAMQKKGWGKVRASRNFLSLCICFFFFYWTFAWLL